MVDRQGPTAAAEAPLLRRFLALLVDWIACVLVARVFTQPLTNGWVAPVVLIVEYTLFVGFFGFTPGMWITGLRCVRYADGRVLGPLRAFVRAVLLALLVPALLMDGQRRGLHDRAAGSIVLILPGRSSR